MTFKKLEKRERNPGKGSSINSKSGAGGPASQSSGKRKKIRRSEEGRFTSSFLPGRRRSRSYIKKREVKIAYDGLPPGLNWPGSEKARGKEKQGLRKKGFSVKGERQDRGE